MPASEDSISTETIMNTMSATALSCITLIAAGAVASSALATDSPPAGPPVSASAPSSVLSFSPATLDLGEMTAGQPRTADLTITNTSDGPVTVESIKGGCGCTKVTEAPKGPIAPGASFTVQVTMDPGMKTGIALRKPVHVALAGGRVESMHIVATVKTVITVTPEVVDAAVKPGAAGSSVTLSSVDAKPFRITAITPSGVAEVGSQAASGTHELKISLEAWHKAGQPATILITTDRPDAPTVAVPVKSAQTVGMFRLPAAADAESPERTAGLQDSIIRDIDAALATSERSPQFRMRLHRESGMLFVHGSDEDLSAVREAVRTLPASSNVRESAPTPGL